MEASLEAASVHAAVAEIMPIDRDRDHEYDQAIRFAEEAAEHDPSSEEPAAMLARLYGPGGPKSDADALQRIVARLRRDCPDCRFPERLAAQIALQQGRFEQALESALSLYEADPVDADALLIALLAWQRLDRVDDAVRWLRAELDRRP